MSHIILDYLSSNLGEPLIQKKSNYCYYCPFCHHRKKKLVVNIKSGLWHCWVCNTKGYGVSNLFKKIGVNQKEISEIKKYENYTIKNNIIYDDAILVKLPKEYKKIPIYEERSILENKIYTYLTTQRGLRDEDIIKYSIGYYKEGSNYGSIILPSYDHHGMLNYYVTKNINNGKYVNPELSKDIVPFDFFISWEHDIVIVEGILDAIAIRRNAIPLMGKIVSRSLKEKILTENCKNFIICLDADAYSTAIEISDYILSCSKNVKLVKLENNQDPSSLGYHKIWEHINQASYLTQDDLFLLKLQNKW